jgi:hypothetical protein
MLISHHCGFGIFVYALADVYNGSWSNCGAVPNLSKLTEEQVEEKLDEMDLDYVLYWCGG